MDPSGRKITWVDGTTVAVTVSFAVEDCDCNGIGRHASSAGIRVNDHHPAHGTSGGVDAFALRACQIIVSCTYRQIEGLRSGQVSQEEKA